MVKRLQCFLSDKEAFEMEKAKEKLEVTSDYAFVKLAIAELCVKCNGGELSEVEGAKRSSLSSFKQYLERARYVCGHCGFPLVRVEGLRSCPACGHTKYKEVR